MRYEFADLIVVGGGLLGAWVAAAAQRQGLSALLLEQGRPGQTEGATSQTPSPFTSFPDLPLAAPYEFATRQSHLLIGPRERLRTLDGRLLEPAQLQARLPQLHPTAEVWGLDCEAYSCDFVAIQKRLWDQNLQAGVKCFADSRVLRLDLEHERPTAICRDVAMRGKMLICAAGQGTEALWGEIPGLVHTAQQRDYFDFPPDSPPLPPMTVLFTHAPVYLEHHDGSFTLHRNGLREAKALQPALPDAEETRSLARFRRAWLPDYADATGGAVEVVQETRDGLPILSPHAWRADVAVLAGLGPWGLWMAEEAAEIALRQVTGQQPSDYSAFRPALLET